MYQICPMTSLYSQLFISSWLVSVKILFDKIKTSSHLLQSLSSGNDDSVCILLQVFSRPYLVLRHRHVEAESSKINYLSRVTASSRGITSTELGLGDYCNYRSPYLRYLPSPWCITSAIILTSFGSIVNSFRVSLPISFTRR